MKKRASTFNLPPVVIDFESYYNPAEKYSLTSMTYEEYVRDPRFQEILCSFYLPEEGEHWHAVGHKNIHAELTKLRLHECTVAMHNAPFDAFILYDKHGIEAAEYICTLALAKPHVGAKQSVSLGKLAELIGLPPKGDEVVKAMGMRLEDFTKQQLRDYAAYGQRDDELCWGVFNHFRGKWDSLSMEIMSDTIRCGVIPQLQIDVPLLEAYVPVLIDRQRQMVEDVAKAMGMTYDELTVALGSNHKFARCLEQLGVEAPLKISPRTGKEAYAFAKTDMGFKDLLEGPDPRVSALCEARLGNKSNISVNRAQRLIDIGRRGRLPVPLDAFGAGTSRWTALGGQRINFQNNPKRGGDITVRQSIMAPPGYHVVTCDLSQIEARRMAAQAGQTDLVELFKHNQDPYSVFASTLYGYPVSKQDPNTKKERNVGKECIAAGSAVLTHRGLVRIENITRDHKLWDGIRFVSHDGLINQGMRKVLTYDGLTATPDHEVFCADGFIRTLADAAAARVPLIKTGHGNTPKFFDDCGFTPRYTRQKLSLYCGGGDATLPPVDHNPSLKRPVWRSAVVYDIANAGPARRFTVNGCLVLNCILSMGYGAGAHSFWLRLRAAYNLDLGEEFCENAVGTYRREYSKIVAFWRDCQTAIKTMRYGGEYVFGADNDYTAVKGGIYLPDGYLLKYEQIHEVENKETGRTELEYLDRTKRTMRRLYRGIVANNTTQGSSARILMNHIKWLRDEGVLMVGTVHDELIFLVPDCDLEPQCRLIYSTMKRAPAWAVNTPIDCELSVGPNYGDQYDLDVYLEGSRTKHGAEAVLLDRARHR